MKIRGLGVNRNFGKILSEPESMIFPTAGVFPVQLKKPNIFLSVSLLSTSAH